MDKKGSCCTGVFLAAIKQAVSPVVDRQALLNAVDWDISSKCASSSLNVCRLAGNDNK